MFHCFEATSTPVGIFRTGYEGNILNCEDFVTINKAYLLGLNLKNS